MGAPRDYTALGRRGEGLAADLVQERGFEILARNYRYGVHGEIDIIARKGSLLVFIEVKTRRSAAFGGPLHSIGKRKQQALRAVATYFLTQNPQYYSRGTVNRFDLIALSEGATKWHEDIFR